MIKRGFYFFLIFLLFVNTNFAQDSIPKIEEDLKYREDQFYAGITYNLLLSVPDGVSPDGITGGINFGFLRDMPINKKRNLAFAVGLGLSFDRYGQNLLIDKDANGDSTFEIVNTDDDFKSNKLITGILEIPIELRWRSSTPSIYKFWRVYAGFRIGYSFLNEASFKGNTYSVSHSTIDEYEKLRLATTLSFGFNKFNFLINYSINPFFNEEAITTDGQEVIFKTLKLGLIFYIL